MEQLKDYASSDRGHRHFLSLIIKTKLPELPKGKVEEIVRKLQEGVTHFDLDGIDGFEDGDVIQIADSDIDTAFDQYIDVLLSGASSAVVEFLEDFVPEVVEEMAKNRDSVASSLKKDRSHFEESIDYVWGDALMHLETYINASVEAAEQFTETFEQRTDDDTPDIWHRAFALRALHARGCRTALEILALLRAGFADGAMARWRALHEIAIIAMFLSEKDDEQAKRYLEHEVVATSKRLKSFQEHFDSLGEEPVEAAVQNQIQQRMRELESKYGRVFLQDYGWATYSMTETRRITLRDLEAAISLDHLRPYYLLACESIHAGSGGCYTGMSTDFEDGITPGATMMGMACPGRRCALSLAMISAALLTSPSDLDDLVNAQVLMHLSRGVAIQFSEARECLDDNTVELPFDPESDELIDV